jgi:phosphoserine phosphatase
MFCLIILLRKYSGESYESTISSQAEHRESGAWVVFASGGGAVVAGDVVEFVAVDEEF